MNTCLTHNHQILHDAAYIQGVPIKNDPLEKNSVFC